MAVTVTVAGQSGYALPVSGSTTPPGVRSTQCPVTMTPGDWLFAIVTWRQTAALERISFSIADDGHNWWDPVGIPSGTSSASGLLRIAVWRSPAASFCSNVMAAPSGIAQSCCLTVLDASGMGAGVTDLPVQTAFANAATSITTLTGAAPASQGLLITGFGVSTTSPSVTLSGAGWTSVTAVSTSNGTDTTSDLSLNVAYQVTTGSTSAAWSESSGTQALTGILAGVLTTAAAPSQPDAYWPATILEMAPNGSPSVFPDFLTWVNTTSRFLELTVTQGRQYQLGQLQAAQGTLKLDNPDGAVVPPGSGSWAGISSGAPVRLRQYWAGGAWQLQFHGNGSTAVPEATSGNIFTVSAGQAYTSTAWLASSVPYASGVTLQIQWRTSGGTLISTSNSAAVVTGTLPVISVASGTAPGTAALANVAVVAAGTPASSVVFSAAPAVRAPSFALAVPAGTTWSAVNSATITLNAWTAPDRRGPPNISPWTIPFSGYALAFPEKWDAETLRGYTEISVTDAWGYLTANLQPILQQEILNEQPYAYWPCTDTPPVSYASNMAPGNGTPLNVTSSKYGTGGATQSFGQNGDALLGAQGTIELTSSVRSQSEAGMWQQVLGNATLASEGSSLACTDTGFPAISGGVSVEFWFQLEAAVSPPDNNDFILLAVNGGPAGRGFGIIVDNSTGHLILETSGTNISTLSTVNYVPYGSNPGPLTQCVITFTLTTWTAYVNGAQVASGNWVPALTGGFSQLSVAGIAGTALESTQYNFWNFAGGFFGHVAVFPQILTTNRVLAHYNAGIAGCAGDSAVSRIERLLQATPFLGRRCILQEATAGTEQTLVASCQDIGGQAASISLGNISVNTIPGQLYNAPCGDLFYQAKSYSWNNPVNWVLGNRPDLGEIQFAPGIEFSDDPQRVVNSIQLTQLDNLDIITPSGSIMSTIEAASRAQYGSLSYWQTGYLQGDLTEPLTFGPGLFDLANYIAAVNANPVLRVSQISVEAASLPLAWAFWAQASPGDMVTVNWRPPTNTGQTISATCRISQTARTIRSGMSGITGLITCLIDAAPEQTTLTVNDPVLGQLTGTNILAW
jgi:Concanavalin A-like lectin/glucanases superfamily